MKNIKIFILLMLIISCSDNNVEPDKEKVLYGNFNLSYTTTYTNAKIIGPIIGGDIYYESNNENDFTPVDAGTMFISNTPLVFDPIMDKGKYYAYSYGGLINLDTLEIKPILGGIGKWGISGKGSLKEYYINLYTPAKINIYEPQPNLTEVSNEGFLLRWEKDENCDSIKIVLDIPIDSSYDENDQIVYTLWSKIVANNGEFFIPSEILHKNDTINVSLYQMLIDSVINSQKHFIFNRIISTDINYIVK